MVVQVEPLGEIYELRPQSELLLTYDLALDGTRDTLQVDFSEQEGKAWLSVWVHSEEFPLVFIDGGLVGFDRPTDG